MITASHSAGCFTRKWASTLPNTGSAQNSNFGYGVNGVSCGTLSSQLICYVKNINSQYGHFAYCLACAVGYFIGPGLFQRFLPGTTPDHYSAFDAFADSAFLYP